MAQEVVTTKAVPHSAPLVSKAIQIRGSEPTISELNRKAAEIRRETDNGIPKPKAVPPGAQAPNLNAVVKPIDIAEPFDTTVFDPASGSPESRQVLQVVNNHRLLDTEGGRLVTDLAEPSLAARGREILLTFNVFAAFSRDGGRSFAFVNPESKFPAPGSPYQAQTFFCDQVAIYEPKRDMMVWYMQHHKDVHGNRVRLAVSVKDDIAWQKWQYYDFLPQETGGQPGEWYDFPDLAVSDQFLYFTTNAYSAADHFVRAVVVRVPLDALKDYKEFEYRYFDTLAEPVKYNIQVSSIRLVQGATSVMHAGAHFDFDPVKHVSYLRVYSWDDKADNAKAWNSEVSQWSNAVPDATGPDGLNWLQECDGRITAAWLSGGRIGFGWTTANDRAYSPYPLARFAVLEEDTKKLIAQPHMYNQLFAFGYPAVAANGKGEVSVSVNYGGGSILHPSHAVGFLETYPDGRMEWGLRNISVGQRGPAGGRYGDYQVVRPVGPKGENWAAVGFSLLAITPAEAAVGKQNKCELHYVEFRGAGSPQAPRPAGGGGTK
jgi:hypothetical protein